MALTPRERRLQSLYGIGEIEYAQILAAQGGVCAVCGREPRPAENFDVDHDHVTRKVRGLICRRDNAWLIGRHRDPALFAAASRYLAAPPADVVLPAEHRTPKKGTRPRKRAA